MKRRGMITPALVFNDKLTRRPTLCICWLGTYLVLTQVQYSSGYAYYF